MSHEASTLEERFVGLHNVNRVTAILVTLQNILKSYIAVRIDFLQNYIDLNLGTIHDC